MQNRRKPMRVHSVLLGIALVGILCIVGIMSGCSGNSDSSNSTDSSQSSTQTSTDVADSYYQNIKLTDVTDMSFDFSDRDTDASYDESSATKIDISNPSALSGTTGVTVSGNTITVNQAGTYLLSGTLENGQVAVEVSKEDKVQLVLNGVTITNQSGPALMVNQADKVFVTLAASSTNTLSDGSSYTLADGEDEPNATLYSKEDLCLNGSGALTINANYKHAINSKDDLKITGGTYTISAAQDAMRGKDCVKINNGTFNLTAAGDGIQSSNSEDEGTGFVYISGGNFTIAAGDDGMQAATRVGIAGGTFSIGAGDDAFHSDLQLIVDGGTFEISAEDDAFHAETSTVVNQGTITVDACYEGLEASKIYVNDGSVVINASDDGINASPAFSSSSSSDPGAQGGTDPGAQATTQASGQGSTQQGTDPGAQAATQGGTDPGAQGGGQGGFQSIDPKSSDTTTPPTPPSGGNFDSDEGFLDSGNEKQNNGGAPDNGFAEGGTGMAGDESCSIQINGGTIFLNTYGDSIDSNGSVEITGGTVLVSGPISDGDAAFDYDLTSSISGGTVLMLGSSSMAQNFTSGTQPFIFSSTSGNAGQNVAITDETGNVLVSLTAVKDFAVVQASSPSMQEGGSYNIVVGGEVSGADANGFATGGTVSGGTSTAVTASTTAKSGFGGMSSQGDPMGAGQKGDIKKK